MQSANSNLLNERTKEYFNRFLHWMSDDVGNFKKISERDISEHFSESFEYVTDDAVGATNPEELHQRFEKAKEKFKNAYIHFSTVKEAISGNQVEASYLVTFNLRTGESQNSTNTIHVQFDECGKACKFKQKYTLAPSNCPQSNTESESKSSIGMNNQS